MIPVDNEQVYEKQPGQWRRKGENGPPIVTDPNGEAVQSGRRRGAVKYSTYSRPSSFGKQVENTYNLQRWSERMVAVGALLIALAHDEDGS